MESIRATIFPAAGVTPTPDTWWRVATNTDPNSRTSKPATREHVEEGPFADAHLVLTINPLGIMQWQLGAPPLNDLPTALPTVGPFLEKASEFLQLLNRWFPLCPTSSRIACGIVAILPVDSHREAYETLDSLLHAVDIDPVGSSELLYRINRPRPSRLLQGLTINRLSTWLAVKVTLTVGLAEGQSVQGGREAVLYEKYVCRAQLDINTAPSFQGTFPPPSLSELYGELYQLAVEILAKGDIP